jgi:hypothetical protein
MPFTKAEQKGHKIYYYEESGKAEIRSLGQRAWRNNNPGNTRGIRSAIGRDHDGFDIFPDHETGRRAKKDLIKRRYADYSSIREMLKGKFDKNGDFIAGTAWAPASDKNDPDRYADQIRKWTGLDVDNTKIKDLKSEEMEKLLDAIQRQEGFQKGTIEVIEPSRGIPQGVVPPQAVPSSIRDRWPWDSNNFDDALADRWKNMLP